MLPDNGTTDWERDLATRYNRNRNSNCNTTNNNSSNKNSNISNNTGGGDIVSVQMMDIRYPDKDWHDLSERDIKTRFCVNCNNGIKTRQPMAQLSSSSSNETSTPAPRSFNSYNSGHFCKLSNWDNNARNSQHTQYNHHSGVKRNTHEFDKFGNNNMNVALPSAGEITDMTGTAPQQTSSTYMCSVPERKKRKIMQIRDDSLAKASAVMNGNINQVSNLNNNTNNNANMTKGNLPSLNFSQQFSQMPTNNEI